MDFKNFFNKLFEYNKTYNFSIMTNKDDSPPDPKEKQIKLFSNNKYYVMIITNNVRRDIYAIY